MQPPLEERLARLEANLAHVERLNEQLNEVVVEQGLALAKLQTAVRQLSDTVKRDEIERIRANNPRPPHA